MSSDLYFAVIVFLFSLACADQDIKEKKVPNLVLISAIASGLVLRCVFDINNLWLSALCGTGAGLFYFLVRMITHGRLGIADVLFGVFQGLILFPLSLLICLLIECAAAGAWFHGWVHFRCYHLEGKETTTVHFSAELISLPGSSVA